MTKIPYFHLLIAAAGSGERLKTDIPKQYLKVAGKTILEHTIDAFYDHPQLKSLTVIVNESQIDLFKQVQNKYKNIDFCMGCNTRKSSIYNGLKSFTKVKNDEIIFIHDAARPMVKCADIDALLVQMNASEAATLASVTTDTIIKDSTPLDRDSLHAIKTPQAFHYGVIKQAHEEYAKNNSFTDDAGLVRAMGKNVDIVPAN